MGDGVKAFSVGICDGTPSTACSNLLFCCSHCICGFCVVFLFDCVVIISFLVLLSLRERVLTTLPRWVFAVAWLSSFGVSPCAVGWSVVFNCGAFPGHTHSLFEKQRQHPRLCQ